MAFDTFMVIAGVYPDLESAEADYELVQGAAPHRDGSWTPTTRQSSIAVEDGKVKITKQARDPHPGRRGARWRSGSGYRTRRRALPVRGDRRWTPRWPRRPAARSSVR